MRTASRLGVALLVVGGAMLFSGLSCADGEITFTAGEESASSDADRPGGYGCASEDAHYSVARPLQAAGQGGASRLGALPANEWTLLTEGDFKITEPKGTPCMVYAGLVWMPQMDCGMILPQVHPNHVADVMLFCPEEKKWLPTLPGRLPAGRSIYAMLSPHAYVCLPGLKRVLVLKQEGRGDRQPACGWLVDPAAAAFEPVDSDLSMSDTSTDFHPVTWCRGDGLRIPLWGALCYDAHNREAVSFGGGATWGRVGKRKETVGPGDWIYDAKAGRIRRLTADDKEIIEARRWFPAHCGTWAFSEAEKTWTPIPQPMREQPAGRILAGMVYDSAEKRIVLFGGDDEARCLRDTWVYDCGTKTWKQVHPKVSPPARASFAMVYVPDQKAVLIAGGYGPGYHPLKDVWVYRTARNEWTPLDLDLPIPTYYASADYDPKRKAVVLAAFEKGRYNTRIPVYALGLDLASAPVGKAAADGDPRDDYHCRRHYDYPMPLPDEWLTGKNAPGSPEEGRKELAALPANVWVERKPPALTGRRAWGSYLYDPRTHIGYAWGGGHGANYDGADVSEYHVLINRWRGMVDATNYPPLWLHPAPSWPPGVTLGGWSHTAHARRSYGVDPLSGSVITYAADVYSMKHHMFVTNIGKCPGQYGPASQVSVVTTSHGLYGYSSGLLVRADVAACGWQTVARGGPPSHHEDNHLCYDPKRDRAIYFRAKDAEVWAFDFKRRQWARETPAGGKPSVAYGDSTCVPEMDAVLLVFSEAGRDARGPDAREQLYFYRLDERRWYTAPYRGDRFRYWRPSPRNYSPHYDPELKVVVRLMCHQPDKWTRVFVMRLDPAQLELTPVEGGT